MEQLLEVRGLCKKYDAFALRDVHFDLPRGYIMGFIGPNGAGKTTTIKLILRILTADAGSVKFLGEDMTAAHNEQIGIVMDAPMYVEDWTLRQVERAIAPFYASWDTARYAKYLREFGLNPQKKVKELSRGMKVKLQIAAALSHNAVLLLLDEPTSGLDPVARDEICDLLRGFVADERRSVLFSTHITADLDKTADYITFILNGTVRFTGEREALLEQYTRVTGGPDDLSAEHKRLVIGYREHATGFEGMVESKRVRELPHRVVTEAISLDEIIIFMNQGAKLHG